MVTGPRIGVTQAPPIANQGNGFIHMKLARSPNSNKGICSLDYQYGNKYTKVPNRVTCGICLAMLKDERWQQGRFAPYARLMGPHQVLIG